MNRTAQNILYFPVYAILRILSLLPLPILHGVARVLYFIAYYIVGYRRKVTRDNMAKAFPEKSEAELLSLEKKFYKYFTDYIVETIKLLHISDAEMRRRMEFVNVELINQYTQQGRSVMLLLGHYGNWEWVTSIKLWCEKADELVIGQIYSPLHNSWFDRFFLRLRSRFGTVGIPYNSTLRELVRYQRQGIATLIGFISDQSPSWNSIHHYTSFMGRDTAVITGFETIAKKLDMAVVYLDVELIKRGYYKATFRLIEDKPAQCADFDITDRYIVALEKTIHRNPHAWLWTHRRWKYQRPQNSEK